VVDVTTVDTVRRHGRSWAVAWESLAVTGLAVAAGLAIVWAVTVIVRRGFPDAFEDEVWDYAPESPDWRRVRRRDRRDRAAWSILTLAGWTALFAAAGGTLVACQVVRHYRLVALVTMTGVGLAAGLMSLTLTAVESRRRQEVREARRKPLQRPGATAFVRPVVAAAVAAAGTVVLADAHAHAGWPRDWRISAGVGLLVSAATIALLVELSEPIGLRRRRLAVLAVLTGPLLALAAGAWDVLTGFEQALLTEAGVGLALVGVIELGFDALFRRYEASDAAMGETVSLMVEAALSNEQLLYGEEQALREMLGASPDRLAFPMLWNDLKVRELADELKAGRDAAMAAAAQRRTARLHAYRDEVREQVDTYIQRIAADFGLDDAAWRELDSFGDRLAGNPTTVAEDVDAELRSFAQWLAAKQTSTAPTASAPLLSAEHGDAAAVAREAPPGPDKDGGAAEKP
jgi:hypothetical protein